MILPLPGSVVSVCTKYQVSTDQLPYKALVVCVPIKYQLTAPEIAPLFNIGHQ